MIIFLLPSTLLKNQFSGDESRLMASCTTTKSNKDKITTYSKRSTLPVARYDLMLYVGSGSTLRFIN